MRDLLADLEPEDAAMLEELQRRSARYFFEMSHPETGLVLDSTHPGADASIAATGLGLAALAVAAERAALGRAEAARRARRTLRFLCEAEQSPRPEAAGYRGLFYHFLDPATGRRARRCELSTIDSAILFAGALAAAAYFDGPGEEEREVRALAEALYRRAEWTWFLDPEARPGPALVHGWRPERGFIPYHWSGYNEALLLYVLALGSPTHPLPAEAYEAWTRGFRWKTLYGIEHLYAGPLFIHQLPHAFLDLRGLRDAPMRERGLDYFENSRRAAYVQQAYARRNPRRLRGYGEHAWGVTASDGPGPATRTVGGTRRRFYGYRARGVPWGLDDGTLAPWATAAMLPFAPEIVVPALRHLGRAHPEVLDRFGYPGSFNPTFAVPGSSAGWVSPVHFGIDQGPVVLMIENARSGLLWRLARASAPVVAGLRRAGFEGGWLAPRRGAGG